MVLDKIKAYGHYNLLCTHETTIEITKEKYLTRKGDCILGIKASKACNDLNENLKLSIRKGNKIKVIIQSENSTDSFIGFGDKNLELTHKKDLVFRKSDYISNRTALIKCSKSSKDLSRKLINEIKSSEKEFYIIFKKL
jgi:hypothetical protein